MINTAPLAAVGLDYFTLDRSTINSPLLFPPKPLALPSRTHRATSSSSSTTSLFCISTIMSGYHYGSQHYQPSSSSSHSSSASHNHHGGRSRRAPRLSASQNSHRQFRGVRSMKELTESPPVSAFRARFEAGRSFDLDDDLEFCPGLLTEDDVSKPMYRLRYCRPSH